VQIGTRLAMQELQSPTIAYVPPGGRGFSHFANAVRRQAGSRLACEHCFAQR
jgi:hypothetical protein